MHELILLELARWYPEIWRRDQNTTEKDLVYILDNNFSIEIKIYSSIRNTYGNRSYACLSVTGRKSEKRKLGYYLVVKFLKLNPIVQSETIPQINLVPFGWLDEKDWQEQVAATGQQARLNPNVERYKLIKLPLL